MYRNRMKKYIAVVLSMTVALTTFGIPNGMPVRAAGGEAGTAAAGRQKARSTETIFEQGTGNYGYLSLSDQQKELYDALSQNLKDFEAGDGQYITVYDSDGKSCSAPFQMAISEYGLMKKSASQVWTAFLADHPWLFWLEDECSVTSSVLLPIVRKTYEGDAAEMKQKREDVKAKIEKETKSYLTTADYYSTTYDKVWEVDTSLIREVEFALGQDGNPEEADWAHTIEGVLDGEHHAAVGEGYARAFAFLLNILDIPNVYVTGQTSVGGQTKSHAWNCVSFDRGETYYYMDLAGDDVGAAYSKIGNSYQYFAMPKSLFEQKHQANTPAGTAGKWLYGLPELGEDTYYTYFVQFGACGMSSEIETEDDVTGFLSRVRALTPNRGNTSVMKADSPTLDKITERLNREVMFFQSDEEGLYILADSLSDFSKGSPNPIFNLDAKTLTIDLGSGIEKTLGITRVMGAEGNYVRWHSDNDQVAVVKTPIYTKMEAGACVQIAAKKAGTATIRADSVAGTMTCTVEVTGAIPTPTPDVTETPEPTLEPTAMPEVTETPKPTLTPEPTSTETPPPTLEPTATPDVTETPKPTLTPGPTTTVAPLPGPTSTVTPPPGSTSTVTPPPGPTSTVTPPLGPTQKPTITPEATATPGMTSVPTSEPNPTTGVTLAPTPEITPTAGSEISASPEVSERPEVSASPEASVSPAASERPEISASPAVSERPEVSVPPSVSGSPSPEPTQGPGAGITTGKPAPAATVSPTGSQPGSPASSPAIETPEKEKKVEVKDLYWDQKTQAVYQVTGTGESGTVAYRKSMAGNAKKVTIPTNVTIQGRVYRVTSIAKKAFAGNTKIGEVSVGKNVRSIGKKAFYGCKNLKEVKNGANVTEIKEGAFRKCTSLTLLVIPKKVKKIGANAYRDCKQLKYIWVKTTSLRPQTIGKNAFAGGYGYPRVKTEKKVWRKYAESFIITGGLSNSSVFIIDPVELVV